MPARDDTSFRAEMPTPTADHASFVAWLNKHGTMAGAVETDADGKQLVQFMTFKIWRQNSLLKSLRSALLKGGLEQVAPNVRIFCQQAPPIHPKTLIERVERLVETNLRQIEVANPKPATIDENTQIVFQTSVVFAPTNDIILNDPSGYIYGGNTVRKTTDTPPKVSVYDLIAAVTGQTDAAPRVIFLRLKNEHPEVVTLCNNFKFPGQGQRLTPVTCARGVVSIINLLPGPKAAQFRAASADLMVRFMGGDESLITQIQRNAELQQQIPSNHPQRLFGEDVEARSKYTASKSTLQLETSSLIGFNKPGVYFIEYGDKILYNLETISQNAKVIGFGHAKFSGAERCNEHRAKMGPSTRVLHYIPTPFYERVEKQLENRLKAMTRIVKGNIVGTSGEMREQFYVLVKDEFDDIVNSTQEDADACMSEVQLTHLPLLIEQEKTKQIKLQLEYSLLIEQEKMKQVVRVKELELEILQLQFKMRSTN